MNRIHTFALSLLAAALIAGCDTGAGSSDTGNQEDNAAPIVAAPATEGQPADETTDVAAPVDAAMAPGDEITEIPSGTPIIDSIVADEEILPPITAVIDEAVADGVILPVLPPPEDIDHTAPIAWLLLPFDGATDFNPFGKPSIVFNEKILDSTLTPDSVTLSSVTGNATISVELQTIDLTYMNMAADATAAVIVPESRLSLITTYTASLASTITDPAGNALQETSWQFTTPDGTWGGTNKVEPDYVGGSGPSGLGFDGDGNGFLVWISSRTGIPQAAWTNIYKPGVGWGTPVQLADDTLGVALLAVSRNGTAIAVGQRYDITRHTEVWASRYTPAGGWGSPDVIASGESIVSGGVGAVGIDDNGNATVVWHGGSDTSMQRVWTNRYVANEGWGTATALDNGGGLAYYPALAVSRTGDAIAAWTQRDGTRFDVWATHYSALSGWSVPELIETNDAGTAWSPRVAYDEHGNAMAVWPQANSIPASVFPPLGGSTTRNDLWANRYTAAGWGTATLIEADDQNSLSDPELGIDAAGNAMVVWTARTNGWSNRYTVGVGWGTPQLFETDDVSGVVSHTPKLTVDRNGNAIVVWNSWTSVPGQPNFHDVWGNRYTPSGGWSTPRLLDAYNGGDTYAPMVASDPFGQALAVWSEIDASNIFDRNIGSLRFQ